MGKQVALLCVAAGLCLGGSCTITPPDGDDLDPRDVPLDQASAVIDITLDTDEADVLAEIEDRFGRTVRLTATRAVEINGEPLEGPFSGLYVASLEVAGTYTVTVREPTRGVESTVVAAPAAFEITAPVEGATASLSGFTVEWTPADADAEVQIALRQDFAGSTKVERFGPAADVGRRTFTAEDLRAFVQGSPLKITVERARVKESLAGLDEGRARVRVSAERNVTPGP